MTNPQIAAELFTTIKAFRPGLASLTIDQFGNLTATMKSARCCNRVAGDLALTGAFTGIEALQNPYGGFFVSAKPKHLK
jgi:hypothetical protein